MVEGGLNLEPVLDKPYPGRSGVVSSNFKVLANYAKDLGIELKNIILKHDIPEEYLKHYLDIEKIKAQGEVEKAKEILALVGNLYQNAKNALDKIANGIDTSDKLYSSVVDLRRVVAEMKNVSPGENALQAPGVGSVASPALPSGNAIATLLGDIFKQLSITGKTQGELRPLLSACLRFTGEIIRENPNTDTLQSASREIGDALAELDPEPPKTVRDFFRELVNIKRTSEKLA